MTNNVINLKGVKELPRNTPRSERSRMDTQVLTLPGLDAWRKPPFQRELRRTPRVKGIVRQIRIDQVIEGVVTLGVLDGVTYLLDGQHRGEAFRMACDPNLKVAESDDEGAPLLPPIKEVLVDLRIKDFDTMAEMAEEFKVLNRPLVPMRNDDIMRAEEQVNPRIAGIRKRCPFIGYDRVRSGDARNPLLSMATAVRIWFGCTGDNPHPGPSSTESVKLLTANEADLLCDFYEACFEAWGRDKEHYKMWSTINIGILIWMWRRVVLQLDLSSQNRATILTRKEFVNCLMALAAEEHYSEWLVGRKLGDRDRSPCYSRIKEIFGRRLAMSGRTGRVKFPATTWS